MNWEVAVSFHGYVGDGGEVGLREVNIFDSVYVTTFPAFPDVKSNFKFDPCVYKGAKSYDAIKKAMVDKFREAGFGVYTHRNSSRVKKHKRLAQVTFKCDQNKLSTEGLSNIGLQLKQRTKRPDTCENRCEFEITVFCAEDDCWYLNSRNDTGSKRTQHRGHVKLPPVNVKSKITDFDEDALELAMQCSELELDDTLIARLVSVRTTGSIRFTPAQIRYAIARQKAEKLCKEFNTTKGMSSAEQLLSSFDALIRDGDELEYIALIHDASDESCQLSMPKGRKAKVDIPPSEMNIKEIRDSMCLNDTQQVLLSFAWISAEEKRVLTKFPELIFLDVTEKTNKEKRSMFIATGIDGLGRIFMALHCFMPNAKAISFNWIYEHAFVELWGDDIVRNIEAVLTDGEHALFAPLENLGRSGDSIWQNFVTYR